MKGNLDIDKDHSGLCDTNAISNVYHDASAACRRGCARSSSQLARQVSPNTIIVVVNRMDIHTHTCKYIHIFARPCDDVSRA
jgi:hypothetical protein